MNNNVFKSVATILSTLMVSGATYASEVPQNVASSLQQREQRLVAPSFSWRMASVEHDDATASSAKLSQIKTQGVKQLMQQFRATGDRDEKEMQQDASADIEQLLKVSEGGDVDYSSMWQFSHKGQSWLVTGSTKTISGLTMKGEELFDGHSALFAPISTYTDNGKSISFTDPNVWMTSGESVRDSSPVPNDLSVAPEHFAMFAGLNPLTLHGVQWALVSTSPTSWVVEAHLSGSATPETVQITLDRKHGGAPSDIRIEKAHQLEDFSAKSFRSYQGEWIADKVHVTLDAPKIVHSSQEWTLQDVSPSQQIAVTLQQHNPVHDYRLLGTDLTWRTIQMAEMQRHHDIVYYRWPGHFPDLNELGKLHQDQHPGEATPDPSNKASMLQGSAGLLCLAAGVLLYRRRGSMV